MSKKMSGSYSPFKRVLVGSSGSYDGRSEAAFTNLKSDSSVIFPSPFKSKIANLNFYHSLLFLFTNV
jgi:hypothetical protein